MTLSFTGKSSRNGDEPTELLIPLAFEYLAELNRRGMIELLATVGKDGQPVLLAVIPSAKVEDGKIVIVEALTSTVGEAVGDVGTRKEGRHEEG